MASCATFKEMLSNYLENTLDVADKSEIQSHLEQCHACRQIYQQVQVVTQRLGSVSAISVSADFEKNLRLKILADANAPKNVFPLRNIFYGLSGAAAVAAASFLIVSNLTDPTIPAGGNSNLPETNQPLITNQQVISAPVKKQNVTVQQPDVIVVNKSEKQDSLKKEPMQINKDQIKLVDQQR